MECGELIRPCHQVSFTAQLLEIWPVSDSGAMEDEEVEDGAAWPDLRQQALTDE